MISMPSRSCVPRTIESSQKRMRLPSSIARFGITHLSYLKARTLASCRNYEAIAGVYFMIARMIRHPLPSGYPKAIPRAGSPHTTGATNSESSFCPILYPALHKTGHPPRSYPHSKKPEIHNTPKGKSRPASLHSVYASAPYHRHANGRSRPGL